MSQNRNGTHKPTLEEFTRAWKLAKGYAEDAVDRNSPKVWEGGFTSEQIKHEDTAAEYFRKCLGPKWYAIPLDLIRRWCETESKAGREWGAPERTDEDRIRCALANIVKLYKPADSHSEKYHQIHNSDEFRRIVASLKRAYEFHCQLCSRVLDSTLLEGHIVDYHGDNWKKPGMILILCRELCHPVADTLRSRRGCCLDDTDPAPLFDSPEGYYTE
jgi:hypothetical protein